MVIQNYGVLKSSLMRPSDAMYAADAVEVMSRYCEELSEKWRDRIQDWMKNPAESPCTITAMAYLIDIHMRAVLQSMADEE